MDSKHFDSDGLKACPAVRQCLLSQILVASGRLALMALPELLTVNGRE